MAGNDFNPGSPSTVGLEWPVDQYGEYALGAWAQRIRSRSAETINRLDLFMHPGLRGFDLSMLVAEIMPAGQEIPSGTVQSITYQPDADQTVTNFIRSGGTTPLYTAIDEGVDAVNTADFAMSTSTSAGVYIFRVASAGFPGTARVLNVTFRCVLSSASGGSTVYIGPQNSGGFYGTARAINSTPTLVTVDRQEIRTLTGAYRPWTPADIIAFDSGVNGWGFKTIAASANVIVYAAEMVVTYQSVENRVAVASYQGDPALYLPPPGNFTFQNFVSLPAGGASWSKPASGDFTVLIRPPNNASGPQPSSPFGLNWLGSLIGATAVPCSVPGVVSARPTLDSFGQVTAVDFTDGTQAPRTAAVILRTTAPAVSQDSLPYAVAVTDGVNHFPDINNGQVVTQRFTAPASSTYRFIRFLIDPGVAIDNLNVRIRRVSDGLQFGSTGVVSALTSREQVADGNGLRLTTVVLSTGATLVNGTQYYVEFTTIDAQPSGTGWRTILLGHGSMAAGLASFGGTTDYAIVGGLPMLNFDIPVRVIIPPTAPAGTPVAVASDKPNNVYAPTLQNCVPTVIQAITVTWNATGLGAQFHHYDIQRKPIFGEDDEWQIVGAIVTEASTSFVDYETPRGVPHEYRVRVVRTDNAESDWSTASSGVTAQAKDCDMIFCTNEQPDLNVAFIREPEQDYIFQAPARDELVQIYGSNFSVAFMEAEDPGLQVGATLTVNFGRAPTIADVQIYDPLRRISRAGLPYVCVLDHVGNRFYAHLQVGAGKWEEPGYRYHADVVITQVTETSSVAVF